MTFLWFLPHNASVYLFGDFRHSPGKTWILSLFLDAKHHHNHNHNDDDNDDNNRDDVDHDDDDGVLSGYHWRISNHRAIQFESQ